MLRRMLSTLIEFSLSGCFETLHRATEIRKLMPHLRHIIQGAHAFASAPLLVMAMTSALITGCNANKQGAVSEAPAAVPVVLKKIQESRLASTMTFVGIMDSRKSIDLFPRVDGYVSQINVTPGQFVKSGQVLIEIDSNKQESKVAGKRSSVELAKADYAKEVGRLGSLEADLKAHHAMVDFTELDYQRYYWLEKRGVVATATVDKEDRNLRVTKARLASLLAEITAQKEVIQRARKRIEEAQAELKSEEVELTYHIVKAPFSGVVGDLPVKIGDYVNSQSKLTKVSKMKPLEINVEVPQAEAKLLRIGTEVELLDIDGSSIGHSSLFYVAPTVNLQSQSVLVKAGYPNSNNELRPDQTVQVRLLLKTVSSISVPTEAISFVVGKAFVFVAQRQQEGGKLLARQRPVQISAIQDNSATIESGLKSGENIVVSGIQLLQDGTPIDAREVD